MGQRDTHPPTATCFSSHPQLPFRSLLGHICWGGSYEHTHVNKEIYFPAKLQVTRAAHPKSSCLEVYYPVKQVILSQLFPLPLAMFVRYV